MEYSENGGAGVQDLSWLRKTSEVWQTKSFIKGVQNRQNLQGFQNLEGF